MPTRVGLDFAAAQLIPLRGQAFQRLQLPAGAPGQEFPHQQLGIGAFRGSCSRVLISVVVPFLLAEISKTLDPTDMRDKTESLVAAGWKGEHYHGCGD